MHYPSPRIRQLWKTDPGLGTEGVVGMSFVYGPLFTPTGGGTISDVLAYIKVIAKLCYKTCMFLLQNRSPCHFVLCLLESSHIRQKIAH